MMRVTITSVALVLGVVLLVGGFTIHAFSVTGEPSWLTAGDVILTGAALTIGAIAFGALEKTQGNPK